MQNNPEKYFFFDKTTGFFFLNTFLTSCQVNYNFLNKYFQRFVLLYGMLESTVSMRAGIRHR